MGWVSTRTSDPHPGINTVPWVFSPNASELRRQADALVRAGVRIIRFNNVTHRTWFRKDTHGALDHLARVVEALLSRRVMVVVSLCTWNQSVTELFANDDPGTVTTGMFIPFQRNPTGAEKSVLDVVTAWRQDILDITMALSRYEHHSLLAYDVWNGGEAWQETFHNWTVTNPNGRRLLEGWENIVPFMVKNLVLGNTPSRVGHYYMTLAGGIEANPPHHYYPGRRTHYLYSPSVPPVWVFECGVPRPNLAWGSAPASRWETLYKWLPRRYSHVIHTFFDGRFRDLTYDTGSTMALWNSTSYQALVQSSGRGIPVHDGWLVEGQLDEYRKIFMSRFGIDPVYLNLS